MLSACKKRSRLRRHFCAEGDLLHLDVTDGSFATHQTWADPLEWVKLKSPFGLEVHLMVDHPEEYVDNWLAAGARRLIVHAESLTPQSMHEITFAPRSDITWRSCSRQSRNPMSEDIRAISETIPLVPGARGPARSGGAEISSVRVTRRSDF